MQNQILRRKTENAEMVIGKPQKFRSHQMVSTQIHKFISAITTQKSVTEDLSNQFRFRNEKLKR